MQCTIYKGPRKVDHYLYVAGEDDLSRVPQALLDLLGPLQRVMSLELDEARQLAQADIRQVMQSLRAQGYYLQIPPNPAVRDNPGLQPN